MLFTEARQAVKEVTDNWWLFLVSGLERVISYDKCLSLKQGGTHDERTDPGSGSRPSPYSR
jgi:hypothetical protein